MRRLFTFSFAVGRRFSLSVQKISHVLWPSGGGFAVRGRGRAWHYSSLWIWSNNSVRHKNFNCFGFAVGQPSAKAVLVININPKTSKQSANNADRTPRISLPLPLSLSLFLFNYLSLTVSLALLSEVRQAAKNNEAIKIAAHNFQLPSQSAPFYPALHSYSGAIAPFLPLSKWTLFFAILLTKIFEISTRICN